MDHRAIVVKKKYFKLIFIVSKNIEYLLQAMACYAGQLQASAKSFDLLLWALSCPSDKTLYGVGPVDSRPSTN